MEALGRLLPLMRDQIDLPRALLRGRYMATFGLSWEFALALAPLLGGVLFARDPRLLWGTCLVLGLAAAWLVWLASRLHDARAATAGARLPPPAFRPHTERGLVAKRGYARHLKCRVLHGRVGSSPT